ncbi:tripartite tricarboxylate transporter substrate binding protein [Polynucleobacter sp. AP-Melu-500A-A1]|uniref:tripartite tricarboxylate transporter substrate binding protein n=1 Tax=Polynucleobacter sp. AP-Melu-500A-A1 TaxID=2576929 RepID=UPI001C0AEC11|nr:tripartite tricarboxylate transporter substrate binding protein [Polynucleobacter sp. AP-Melu-500A-A1]MBU3631469.1 tripartite tricarboxylate transporter substrate binding protein [Polynucleobacter sp. AP-Melu-500A-A1]
MNRIFQKVIGAPLILVCAMGLANAQSKEVSSYPNKPIRIINPLAVGGAVDTMARMLAPALQEILGQTIVIESKPGAGGTIGSNFVAKSPPDGYTILMVYDTFAVNPHVYKNLPFDSFKDLAPVTELVKIPLVVVAGNKLPANNLRELTDLSKTKTNGINFSSGGAGSSGHLAAELLKTNLGIDMTHVPYKGGGPAMTATISGETDITILGAVITVPQIKGGNLKALAVLGKKRTPALPQVPTASEQGLSNFDVSSWVGVLVPAGTPAPIIDKINNAFAQALKSPAVQARMAEQGNEVVASSPAQFGVFLNQESVKWAKVIKDNNIQLE